MRLQDIEQFRAAVAEGAWLVIVDKATGTKQHKLPCSSVKELYFVQKVIDGREKNGSYHAFKTRDAAGDAFPAASTACRCLGAAAMSSSDRRESPSEPGHAPGRADDTGAIFTVRGSGDAGPIRIGSPFPLPFEPKGDAVLLRDHTRRQVASLRAGADEILRGCLYADRSALVGSPDAENILFYNVGAGSFAGALSAGLAWEFAPDGRMPEGFEDRVVVEYAVESPDAVFRHWSVGEAAVELRSVEIPALRADSKPAGVWRAIHDAPGSDVRTGEAIGGDFGLDLVLHVPASDGVSMLSVVKPLVDGLTAAFHAHDGSNLEEIARRLSGALGEPGSRVAARLQSSERAVLGRCTLLWARANGVQWNPGDDRCRVARIRPLRDGGSTWRVSGTLFPVMPR